MPRYLSARPPGDLDEAQQVRRQAHSRHAPADGIMHAKMVVRSWEGQRTCEIAQALSCHPQTVRDRLHAFNARGLEGLGMKSGSGRKPRLSEQERSVILALVKAPLPGKPTYELRGELAAPDPEAESEWTLDTLTAAARERGIQVARSQVRRIFRREGGALASDATVGDEQGSRLRPKRTQIVALYSAPPRGRWSSVSTSSAL